MSKLAAVPNSDEYDICHVRFYINANGELNAYVEGFEVQNCSHGIEPNFRDQVRALVDEADWFERLPDPKPVRRRPLPKKRARR